MNVVSELIGPAKSGGGFEGCAQGVAADGWNRGSYEAIADRWGRLAALAAAKGKPVPVMDGLLVATALHHNLTLVTRIGSDVAGTTGVPTLNSWL